MAYFTHVNDTGGLFNKKIVTLTKNDGYNPTPAVLNTKEFIDNPDVLLLFNYVGTPTVTRILPLLKIYDKQDIFLFFPFSGAQTLRENPFSKYVFNLRDSYRQETKALVDKFVELGCKRIAVFYQADAYGRSGWSGIRRALKAHGLELAGEATYHRGTPFSESLIKQAFLIRDAKPDAIISVGSYEACAAFIRDARDVGLDAPIANLSFVGSESLLHLLETLSNRLKRDYLKKLINTQVVPCYMDTRLPAVREYRELMEKYADTPIPVEPEGYVPQKYSFVSFEGFLNAKTLVEVIRRYGKIPTRAEVPEMMYQAGSFDIGIGSPIHFAPDKHQGLQTVYFTTVINGEFMPLTDWSPWKK